MKKLLLFLSFALLAAGCSNEEQKPRELEHGKAAYTIPEKELFPEGITWSEKTGAFYVSSIYERRILKVDEKTGEYEEFANMEKSGYLPGVGLYAYDEKNELWACGSDNSSLNRGSKVFVYNLETGELKRTYEPADTTRRFLNDLTITEDGSVYVTDTYNSVVYRIPKGGEMEIFYKGDKIKYPNGITHSPDGSLLYVASVKNGVYTFDAETAEIVAEPDPALRTEGIDGLKFYEDGLYAVQISRRIIKLDLDDDLKKITRMRPVDQNNPLFNLATTFTIKDDSLYVVATSQLPLLDQPSNTIKDTTQLKDIIITSHATL